MKPQEKRSLFIPRFIRMVPVIAGIFGILRTDNAAGSAFWDPTGTTLNTTADGSWEGSVWAPNGTPTASPTTFVEGSFVVFSVTGMGATSCNVTANANHTFAGIYNGGTGGATTCANLVISGTGILSFSGVQGFSTSSGGNTKINNVLAGTGTLQNGSSGQLYLNGTNTFSGGVNVNAAGLINFNNIGSFGTGNINWNSGGSGGAFIPQGTSAITITNNFVVNATYSYNLVGLAAGITYGGNWSLGTNVINLGCGGGTSALDVLSGVISGTGGFGRQSSASHGTIRLTGANTYKGKSTFQSSVTEVSSINRVVGGNPSSNLGAPTNTLNGTLGFGATTFTGTLRYTGTGETTDRVIDLAGTTGGGKIQNDGTGPLVFTTNCTATGVGPKALTLQGSNTDTNTIAGKIVDSAGGGTAIVKAGVGLWVLTGTNTCTGGVSVTGGTLEIGPTGSVPGKATNSAGILQLDNARALSSSGSLYLFSSLSNGSVVLNFSGTQVINAMYIDGIQVANGTWGSPTSGAQNTSPIFTGNGIISILAAPVIVSQPQSIVCYPDSYGKTFAVTVDGDPSFTYQWKLNGMNIPGANFDSYTIGLVEATDAGVYTCYITNNFGWTNTADATLTVLPTNSYVNAILADFPISYWRLDETNGTLAQDGVGGNVGIYNNVRLNQPGYSQTDSDTGIGVPAAAGRGFVQVTNYSPFIFVATTPFTLETWVNFTNVTGVQRVFSTFSGAAPSWGYAFGINGANGLRFTTSTKQDADQSLSTALVPGLWYYLACICDGYTYHFYVNGVEAGTGIAAVNGGNTGVNVPLLLGGNASTYPAAEQLNGRMDEAAVYSYALSSEQILAHYNARYGSLEPPVVSTPVASPATNYESLSVSIQAVAAGQALSYQWYKGASTLLTGQTNDTLIISPLQLSDSGTYKVEVTNPAGMNVSPDVSIAVLPIPTNATVLNLTNALVLHLPFDSDYQDISGHQNNGTNVGNTTIISDGIIGTNALHYYTDVDSNSYNYVTIGVRPDLQFGTTVDFSVSYWVRQPAGSTYTNLPFFTDAVGSTSHGGFAFAPYAGTGGGGWIWTIGTVTSPNAATVFPDANLINDGYWHNIVHTASRTSTCTTYLDGKQVDSQSIDSAVVGNINTTFAATIGQDPTGMYPVTANADMDDMGVWRRALTPLEVSGIYLAGVSNKVSFAVPASAPIVPVALHVEQANGQWQITWTGAGGSLQASFDVSGVYTNVPGAASPYIIPMPSGPRMFYRLKY